MGYTFRFFLRREVSMPWMLSSVTEERLRFVARAPDGGGHHDVCRDFGVAQDRLQDFRSLQGTWAGAAVRSVATPGAGYVVLPMCPGWTIDLLAEPEAVQLKKSLLISLNKSSLVATSHQLPLI
jgi:hypothetical protein